MEIVYLVCVACRTEPDKGGGVASVVVATAVPDTRVRGIVIVASGKNDIAS